MASEGVHLGLNYHRSREQAEALALHCEQRGARVTLLPFDVGDRESVAATLPDWVLEHGPVDVLVNNAGITKDQLFAWVEPTEWDDIMAVNLGGLYAVTRCVIKGMIRKRWGRIINLTSISGQRGNRGQTAYSTSKAGVIGFTKSLALELASRGITVNAVAPGLIETDMTAAIPKKDEVQKLIPMRRFGRADEVASVIRFLASEDASYITGQVIGVNGGFHT